MTDQDKFDDFIGRAARDLDSAPIVPRDEMWQAIVEARKENAVPANTDAPTTSASESDGITSIASRRSAKDTQHGAQTGAHNPWLRWGAPLAAMLVIGVGLGRMTVLHERNARTTGSAGQNVASNTSTHATSTDRAPMSAADSAAAAAAQKDQHALEALNKPPIVAVAPHTGPGVSVSRRSPRNTDITRSAPDISQGIGKTNGNTNVNTNANTAASATSRALAFHMAAVKHFSRVQTLLVSMPADAKDGHINEIAVRAADLLVNTRLLQDSPAASDKETHKLLDDLELILAQVATISPTKSADDVEMIQDAINKHDVLIRLHAITAGPRLSGT